MKIGTLIKIGVFITFLNILITYAMVTTTINQDEIIKEEAERFVEEMCPIQEFMKFKKDFVSWEGYNESEFETSFKE